MFKEWAKKRKIREDFDNDIGAADKFKFNVGEEDYADDHDHVEKELFKAVMSKYPEESMEFLNNIAARGDEEIASLLRKLNKGGPEESKEPQHQSDGDEVVPYGSDSGFGGEEGGEE